jgi:UDP-N-acetyl-D-mannosaminuronic acid dehydrogenase/UDP-N-acetyl-D-glucosamine dehydrogenase
VPDLIARLEAREARVMVVGQGYVGLLLAMAASDAGFDVVGVEPDAARLEALCAGRSYVEDVPDAVLGAAIERGYRALGSPADAGDFDVAVVAVPTPLIEERPDLRPIEEAAAAVGSALRPGALAVLESTTYPGTTTELFVPAIESASGLRCGDDFLAGYSPERINPGDPVFKLANTPKVVAGVDSASLAAVTAFYGAFIEELVPVVRPEEAELTKLLENTFRHVNIALVNELAVFAHELGVDLWAAIDAASSKPFGFMPFRPGPGAGGHCLPVDPSYLSWQVRRRLRAPFRFVELANEVNDRMPGYVVRRIQDQLNRDRLAVRDARILLLGIAFKPGTSDVRESPSLALADGLRHLGARVTAVDPHVDPKVANLELELVPLDAETIRDADLVVIATDHAEFDYELVVRDARRVFDTRARIPVTEDGRVERL